MQIKYKSWMYEELTSGRLGVHWRIFTEINDALCHDGDVGIRYRGLKPGGPCVPHIKPENLLHCMDTLQEEGWDKRYMVVCEVPPSETPVIQGELQYNDTFPGFYLRYTRVPKPMRPALKQWQSVAIGMKALALLRKFMDEQSIDDMREVLDTYEDSVIEFTCYSHDVRNTRRNTVVWETRNY